MNERNKLVAIFAMIMIGVSVFALAIQLPAAADSSSWYKTSYGNLATDTYSLYPYAPKSLNIGLSQFGELLDGNTKVGLFYDTTDPFGPDTGSPPEGQWIEGWILNCTFVEGGQYANIWAMATYSDYKADGLGIGGDWHENVTVGSTDLSVRGGRKTNAGATTDPLQVLYDGPREFVAMARTTIYETPVHTATNALLNITFTFVFDKVSKQVEILKDIKRIDVGKDIGSMQIEFGDRGEWDLGAGTPPKSYAHVFRDYTTDYDENWQPWYNTTETGYNGYPYDRGVDVVQIIDDDNAYSGFAAFWPKPITTYVGATQIEASRDFILTSTSTVTEDHVVTGSPTASFANTTANITPYPQENASGIYWVEDPMVFYNGQYKVINGTGDASTWVYYCRGNHTVIFPPGHIPQVGDVVRLVYKTLDKNRNDMSYEPDSPFVIGEWAFEMGSSPSIFRGVTVYGITDLHDGTDTPTPAIDREVKYQLDSIFNPWNLNDAVEKKTNRWVDFTFGPSWDSSSMTDIVAQRPVMDVSGSNWDQYNMFAERVEDLNTSVLLHRRAKDPLAGGLQDYTFTVNSSGYAHITGLTSTHYYKITYSTNNTYQKYGNIELFNQTWTDIQPQSNGTILNTNWQPTTSWTDNLNVMHSVSLTNATVAIANTTAITGDHNFTTQWMFNWFAYDFKVFKEDTAWRGLWYLNFVPATVTDTSNTTSFNMSNVNMNWYITPPDLRDLHVDWLDPDIYFAATVTYNATSGNFTVNLHVWTVPWRVNIDNVMYQEWIPGRYEWDVVGRDAASVDSAGASLVTAAFKNKQVEIGLAGADMYSSNPQLQMPWVINKVGTGDAFTNYYYNNTDQRVALRDDWCTTWPITTSNMIGAGGPLINLLSYYANDFTPSLYAESWFTPYTPWQNKIAAITCWNHKAYASTNDTGYSVVSTYLDMNGTEVLVIWGNWGRDTYYVTKWFHEVGIYQLQDAPAGLTSIIVKIDYTSNPEGYKPTGFSIVECLGTISERLWLHETESKGGIHDP